MHLAIDLRIVDAPGRELTGVGRYALETTLALQRVRPDWRLSLYSNRPELLCRNDATTVLATRFPTQHSLGRIMWLHLAAAIPTLRARPDVWFSPAFTLPLWWRGRAVVMVHDLTFVLLRERYRGRVNAWHATAATRWSAVHADVVLCPSEATRKLLLAHVDLDPAKVEVTPEGVAEIFFVAPERRGRDAMPVTRPYLLFVGTWEARKGIATALSALRALNAESRRVDLVLAGQPGWGTEKLLHTLRGESGVEFREKPSDEELAELYRGALALVYPSEMEGFGLPVAEAMACGCPVIATDLPSIREFARDVPFFITAGDSEQLTRHVERLLDEGQGLEERRARGHDAVASLRWSALAERTAELIEQVSRPGHTSRRAREHPP